MYAETGSRTMNFCLGLLKLVASLSKCIRRESLEMANGCENFEMANGHETLEHMNMEYRAAGGGSDGHGC